MAPPRPPALNGCQLALLIPLEALQRLEPALVQLEHTAAPLRQVELAMGPGEPAVIALLGYGGDAQAALARPLVTELMQPLGATLVDVGRAPAAARESLEQKVEALPVRVGPGAAAPTVEALLARTRANLRLKFGTLEALLGAWAQHVMEGGLWVPDAYGAPLLPEVQLTLVAGATEYPGQRAQVLTRSNPAGQAGFWLKVAPSPELLALVEKHARRGRQGRPAAPPPPGVSRGAERYQAVLDVQFKNLEGLATEYATDISHGGMFVRCSPQPGLQTRIDVRLTLPDGEQVQVPAVVSRRVTEGPGQGVGVSFLQGHPEALAPIEAMLSAFRTRRPRVLVVDDEAIWRSSLSRALKDLGAEVAVAADGREGMLKLVDGFFDLDLVILDLHMPNIDGRGLISRVRAHGGEWGLKLFLFSGVGRDELEELRMSGLANGVFSKVAPIDELLSRVARELGLGT